MQIRSESITKLLPALISARTQFAALIKESDNPHFHSHYADLAAVHAACEPALAKHGLAVLQSPIWDSEQGHLFLETTLAHTSGEWLGCRYPILANYQRPQEVGAGLTYARRYSYMSIVGVAPEDDDGETASGRGAASNGYQHHGNGNSNGNGQYRPPAAPPRPAPAPAPPPAAPRPATPQNGPQAAQDGMPRTGRELYNWAREHERQGVRVLKWLGDLGRHHGWPTRIVDWQPDQVALAFPEVCRALGLDAELDQQPDPDDDAPSDAGLYACPPDYVIGSRFD